MQKERIKLGFKTICVSRSKINMKIWIVISLILLSIHLYFVPKQNVFSWSEVEKIEIKQRMDEYPPSMYRLANVLENRLKYLYRFEKIFFSYLNFN